MTNFDRKLAGMIDHTLLRLDATEAELAKLCDEALEYGFASCCVYPKHIPFVKKCLAGSNVKPIAVIDFPKGENSPSAKALETREAIVMGALEIDMVIDKNAIHSKNYVLAFDGIQKVVEASGKIPVKVIIESAELDHEEKVAACVLSKLAGAKFVKTSTGFGKGGATAEDVALMKKTIGAEMEVKASGGIRDLQTAEAMITAGATRLGCSAGVAIVTGISAGQGKY